MGGPGRGVGTRARRGTRPCRRGTAGRRRRCARHAARSDRDRCRVGAGGRSSSRRVADGRGRRRPGRRAPGARCTPQFRHERRGHRARWPRPASPPCPVDRRGGPTARQVVAARCGCAARRLWWVRRCESTMSAAPSTPPWRIRMRWSSRAGATDSASAAGGSAPRAAARPRPRSMTRTSVPGPRPSTSNRRPRPSRPPNGPSKLLAPPSANYTTARCERRQVLRGVRRVGAGAARASRGRGRVGEHRAVGRRGDGAHRRARNSGSPSWKRSSRRWSPTRRPRPTPLGRAVRCGPNSRPGRRRWRRVARTSRFATPACTNASSCSNVDSRRPSDDSPPTPTLASPPRVSV